MRHAALILSWAFWSLLLYSTMTGPALFLSKDGKQKKWFDITMTRDYRTLTDEDRALVKAKFFENWIVPEIEKSEVLKKAGRDVVYEDWMQTPDYDFRGAVNLLLISISQAVSSIISTPDAETSNWLWSAYFSGTLGGCLLVCSRCFFHNTHLGETTIWPTILLFLICRITGSALLAGAVLCSCMSATNVASFNGWLGVIIGWVAVVYTAKNLPRLRST